MTTHVLVVGELAETIASTLGKLRPLWHFTAELSPHAALGQLNAPTRDYHAVISYIHNHGFLDSCAFTNIMRLHVGMKQTRFIVLMEQGFDSTDERGALSCGAHLVVSRPMNADDYRELLSMLGNEIAKPRRNWRPLGSQWAPSPLAVISA